jgi:hypothetical protein
MQITRQSDTTILQMREQLLCQALKCKQTPQETVHVKERNRQKVQIPCESEHV